MTETVMTYGKYPSNFGDYWCGSISRSYYTNATHDGVGDDVANGSSLSIPTTPKVSHQKFTCDAGILIYDYSHFPGNCGIGIYSSINVNQYSDAYYTAKTTEEKTQILNTVFREFAHFIRRHSDKDMIILSDRVGGNIAKLVAVSEGEIKQIGDSVNNANSNNTILMYQTTRIRNVLGNYRKIRQRELVLIPRHERGYGEFFKKIKRKAEVFKNDN